MAELIPHRRRNPHRCVRCRESHRTTPSEWNLVIPGKPTMYLCEPHARYWAVKEGLEVREGQPLIPTP